MRLHFRPRLASYYKAGAVLGAIIASFYLCDFEALCSRVLGIALLPR